MVIFTLSMLPVIARTVLPRTVTMYLLTHVQETITITITNNKQCPFLI